MKKTLNLTDEQREQVGKEIENAFEFVREVLNDPTIIDRIPSGSHIKPIPKEERDPNRHYDVETHRMLITVKPKPRTRPYRKSRNVAQVRAGAPVVTHRRRLQPSRLRLQPQ